MKRRFPSLFVISSADARPLINKKTASINEAVNDLIHTVREERLSPFLKNFRKVLSAKLSTLQDVVLVAVSLFYIFGPALITSGGQLASNFLKFSINRVARLLYFSSCAFLLGQESAGFKIPSGTSGHESGTSKPNLFDTLHSAAIHPVQH